MSAVALLCPDCRRCNVSVIALCLASVEVSSAATLFLIPRSCQQDALSCQL